MFSILFKLKDFFSEYKKNYFISFFSMIFSNLFRVFIPYIIGQTIDYIVIGELTPGLLTQISVVFMVSIISAYLLELLWSYLLFTGAANLQKQIRSDIMNHFLKMRSVYYEKFRVGDLMARSTQDVRSIAETAGYGMMVLMDSTLFLIIIITMMSVTISWKLTLYSLFPLILLGYIFGKVGDLVEKRYTISQEEFSSLNNDVLEVVDGIRVIRAYVKEESYIEKFRQQTESLLEKNNDVAKANALFMPLVKFFTAISTIISFGYGVYLVFNGLLSVGDIIAFQLYLQMIVWPIISVGELTNILRQGTASMTRVEDILFADDDMGDYGGERIETEGSLEMEDLTFQYPSNNTPNLSEITIEIEKGKMLGIVGKTGAGKTTLLRQLLRQYPMGEGGFRYGDTEVSQLGEQELQSLIGYVPQDHILFSRSVRENIAFGKDKATEEEILESVRIASFAEDLKNMSEGLETLVGEKGVSISGGQKQRISLARALIKDPEILMLDDSLSAVDAKTEQNIIANIKENRSGKTTIISTHRLSAIKAADEIIVLDEGRIIERGTHNELVSLQGWYYEQYMRQELKAGDE